MGNKITRRKGNLVSLCSVASESVFEGLEEKTTRTLQRCVNLEAQ